MNDRDLISRATALARPFAPSPECSSGTVAAAILTTSGNVYTGVCVDTRCSLGFCAEHAAAAEMLKARESEVARVVAVDQGGSVIPPCGRCRELLLQINPKNGVARVVLGPDGQGRTLAELLPLH